MVKEIYMNEKTTKFLLEKVKKDYSNISDDFNKTRKHSWKEFEGFLKYIKNDQKIVDLGCGNGRFYEFIKKHKKIQYTGIDNNSPLLTKAKKTYSEASFIKGDLLKIPIQNGKIDTVISIASFHHIPSIKLKEKAINEIYRILKNKGILIITVWNLFQKKYKRYIWQARIKHILSFGKYDSLDTFIPWGKTEVKRYYYAFKFKELKKLLEKKFKILEGYKGNNLVFICRKK